MIRGTADLPAQLTGFFKGAGIVPNQPPPPEAFAPPGLGAGGAGGAVQASAPPPPAYSSRAATRWLAGRARNLQSCMHRI